MEIRFLENLNLLLLLSSVVSVKLAFNKALTGAVEAAGSWIARLSPCLSLKILCISKAE